MKHFNYFTIGLAICASVLALLFPGNTVWLGDEADLLNLALNANEAGELAAHGLYGSVAVAYGALIVWFNQLLLCFTADPVVLAGVKSAVSIAVAWGALRQLAKRFRIPFGPAAAFYFCSPFVFFYIRQPWDNVWLMPLGLWYAVFMAEFLRSGSWRSVSGAALLMAAMFYLHPVAAAVPAGFAVSVLLFCRPLRSGLIRLAVAGAAALLLLSPYLWNCWRDYDSVPREHVFPIDGLLAGVTSLRNLTGLGFPERFSPASGGGVWWILLAVSGLAVIFFALLGIVAVVRKVCRREELSCFDRAAGCGLITIGCYTLLLVVLRLESQVHYNSAVVFAWLLLAWRGFAAFTGDYPRTGRWAAGAALLLELGFLLNFTVAVERDGGGDSEYFGCTLARQWRIAQALWGAYRANPELRVEIRVERLLRDPRPMQSLIRLARRVPQSTRPTEAYRRAVLLPARSGSGFDLLILDRIEFPGRVPETP